MKRPFLRLVTSQSLWGPSKLRLVDVGASCGIEPKWRSFDEVLSAIGFDPLVPEVERLNQSEQRTDVTYEAAFVGVPELDNLFPPALRQDPIATKFIQPFHRSSAVRANELKQRDYVKEQFNQGSAVRYTDRLISLDERFAGGEDDPDFIKIDTDGSDFYVLLGAERLLSRGNVLGIEIESQFHGAVHEYANLFCNIDRFLRERGFCLFDLRPFRYSRAALPAPFAIDLAAQTVRGQVHWAEAVYFRDLGYPEYDRTFGYTTTLERALKLCCLFELFDLQDCAVELVLRCRAAGWLTDVEPLLDALTPDLFGNRVYREYIARFEADPDTFLPSRIGEHGGAVARHRHPPSQLQALQAQVEAARAALDDMREQLRRRKEENAQLKDRLRARAAKIQKLQTRLNTKG